MEINIDAPAITRDEIEIEAPIALVWEVQTDIDSWPTRQPDVETAKTDGPLRVGSLFRWGTQGLDITSTIGEIDPPQRISWGGPAQGIVAVHVWILEELPSGRVLVKTEESWEGEPVEAQTAKLQAALDASLRGWLENLKRTAEGRSGA